MLHFSFLDKNAKIKNNVDNEHFQKLFIFEGFRQHGLHHRIQRIFLHIVAPVKIDLRHFLENDIFVTLESLKKLYTVDVLKAWDYARTIFQSEKLWIA